MRAIQIQLNLKLPLHVLIFIAIVRDSFCDCEAFCQNIKFQRHQNGHAVSGIDIFLILVFPYCALYQIIPARRINAKHQIQGITILDFIVIDNFGSIPCTPHGRINILNRSQTVTGICTFHRLGIETIRLVVIIRHAGHSICHSCIAKALPDRIIYKAVSRQITGRKRPILAGCSVLSQNTVFDDDTISLLVTKIKNLGEPTLRQVIPVQRIVRRCSRCCCRRVSDRVIIAEIIQQRIGKR